MRIVGIETLMMLALTAILGFVILTHHDRDRYFAETSGGQFMQLVSLPYPNMGRSAVSDWVSGAVSQIMTFGFNDIDQRFGVSQHLFTPSGWESFRKALIASGLIKNIMSTQQIITSVPQSVPVLKKEGLIDGRYSWVFDVPLLMTFRAGANKKMTVATVHVVVQKISPLENPRALGISSWYIY